MKILSLNTWGGRAGAEGLIAFFNRMKRDVDIFCLQEIWSAPYEHFEGVSAGGLAIQHGTIMTNGLQDITGLLGEHEYFFHPHFMDNYGLLMLVHKRLSVKGVGEVWVHREKGYMPEGDIGLHPRNLQYVEVVDQNNKTYTVCNFHGLWNGKGKTDSEDRIAQSERIVEFVASRTGEAICIGDFNLLPDTESIAILERARMHNLVREYGITSTRTSLYTKPEKFADYAFVTEGVVVQQFAVLPDVVSDHAPIFLECA